MCENISIFFALAEQTVKNFTYHVNMKYKLSTVFVLAAVLASAFANAQRVLRFSNSETPPPLSLLMNASVQQELRLSGDQKSRIAPLKPTPGETSVETMKSNYAKVTQILTSAQVQRLEQIHRQSMGFSALTYPPYAKLIGASKDQVDKIATANQEAIQDVISHKTMTPGTPEHPARIQITAQDNAKITSAVVAKAHKILSAAQISKWNASLGKPFAVKR